MKISLKLEYACRALAQLAKLHDGKTLTRLEALAQREDVSANFLVQILNDLKRSHLIESRRGQAGGYLLARQPQQISLRQIVDAVDPSLLTCSVQAEGDSGAAVQRAWGNISSSLCNQLDEVTLDQLASEPQATMFHI